MMLMKLATEDVVQMARGTRIGMIGAALLRTADGRSTAENSEAVRMRRTADVRMTTMPEANVRAVCGCPT